MKHFLIWELSLFQNFFNSSRIPSKLWDFCDLIGLSILGFFFPRSKLADTHYSPLVKVRPFGWFWVENWRNSLSEPCANSFPIWKELSFWGRALSSKWNQPDRNIALPTGITLSHSVVLNPCFWGVQLEDIHSLTLHKACSQRQVPQAWY